MLKDDIIYVLFDNWCNDNKRAPEITEAMERAVKNPNIDTIFELSAIVEANAFKSGVRACLDMIHCLFIEERNLDKMNRKKTELTTCESKKPLASEIIADQGKEIEELRAKLVDVIDKLEDCLCVIMDSREKASYILNLSITNHNLLNTDVPTQADLEAFYGQKGKMLTECWIVDDYLDKIEAQTEILDEIQRELDKLQEGGADEKM